MQKKLIKIERAIALADRLQADIVQRQLASGDAYYTTREASLFLDVSGASANRALQLLEQRGVITRSQKKGSLIRNPNVKKAALEHIHFLFDGRLEVLDHFGEEIIHGVRDEMPFSHIAYSMLSQRSEVSDVKELIQQAKESDQTHGFVMISSSPQVQKQLGLSGLPCAILGSRCPGVPLVSNLDIDHEDGFRILLNYLRERQCKKIALVMRSRVLPGDIETINTALRMGVPYCFFLQHKEDDPDLVPEIAELIERKFNADGYVCLTTAYAEALSKAIARSGRDPNSVEIVVQFYYRREEHPPYTHVVPQVNARGMGRRLGRLLYDSAIGMQPKRETTPVFLVTRADLALPVWQNQEYAPIPQEYIFRDHD
ncbi:MAG: GntR family transcriptional regulator [Planctomycetia bacterium]|nr:GntR family transcriptional regulator [Planctomycetia bacterium]